MNNDKIYLRHILEAAQKAVEISQDYERCDLDTDELLGLALERLLEIIGEAANKVSNSTQATYPMIPWRKMAATRNRLIHAYSEVDYEIVWSIVTKDLPPLVSQLSQILNE